VYAALLRLGWTLKKQVGPIESCNVPAGQTTHSAFTTAKEVGPAALSKIGKDTGLRPEDL
jgi:predicted RNA binding protein YcfA (HicA-like mRNA interferase family)